MANLEKARVPFKMDVTIGDSICPEVNHLSGIVIIIYNL